MFFCLFFYLFLISFQSYSAYSSIQQACDQYVIIYFFIYSLHYSAYSFHDVDLNFNEAHTDCIGRHGDLVSIDNAVENSLIFNDSRILNDNYWWIGLQNVSNKWSWTDGTPLNWTKWKKEPPNHECGLLNLQHDAWVSDKCHNRHPYICEYEGECEKGVWDILSGP